MKHFWTNEELVEHFSFTAVEVDYLNNNARSKKMVFALFFKYFQYEGHFPTKHSQISKLVFSFISNQLHLDCKNILDISFEGRTAVRYRKNIRDYFGFSEWNHSYSEELSKWLYNNILPEKFKITQLKEEALIYLQKVKIEPPSSAVLERIISSALCNWEQQYFEKIFNLLSKDIKKKMNVLLINISDNKNTSFKELKKDTGSVSVNSIIIEIKKFEHIRTFDIDPSVFNNIPIKLLQFYRDRVISEPAREMRRHPDYIKYALLSIFLYVRRMEITDGLVDLLIQTIHRIAANAEKRTVTDMVSELKKVKGKNEILYKIAVASKDNPEHKVRDIIFPILNETTIDAIIKEYKYSDSSYKFNVNSKMKSSYKNHYRRILPLILQAIEFNSNNQYHSPVVESLKIVKKYMDSNLKYYPTTEKIIQKGIIPSSWKSFVIEKDKNGNEIINRVSYELCVLEVLRDNLRCKECWVKGANRYRNPDDDLPIDFDEKREFYYELLKKPIDPNSLISQLQKDLDQSLTMLNKNLPGNQYVEILEQKKGQKGWIKLSPIEAQEEPKNLAYLKSLIKDQWRSTGLLDVLKEADLRINFTKHLSSVGQREAMSKVTLQKRLLLCLYAIATNIGIKRICTGKHGEKQSDLMYVLRQYINKDQLRNAITNVVDEILRIRQSSIWGDVTTACASDSKKFGSWNQNLLTEWHNRYGGQGIMIYWHVEKKSTCVYSQLKSCSSSEVASMIEGVVRHCTQMEIEKQYVDTHGQSYVAFAFCHLLGFQLLPRFKGIHNKRLYLPSSDHSTHYPNLTHILTRPINWELIRQQYDQMIKFTTAIRLGTAETEAILKRFTRDNLQHPTYQALMELGKVKRTIFLCNYLNDVKLRQEINEGLNVIELWNGVNDFIFFGKGGEFSTNRKDSQELSVLCLHLLQNCLIYINTLMLQQILKNKKIMDLMTEEDFRGITPLFFSHINPYGIFDINMNSRIKFDLIVNEAA